MKCIECDCCSKGWFPSKPTAYVCTGVKEPFVIENPNEECTEYPEKREEQISYINISDCIIKEPEPAKPYVDEEGIYVHMNMTLDTINF